jgi:hypothetical protein
MGPVGAEQSEEAGAIGPVAVAQSEEAGAEQSEDADARNATFAATSSAFTAHTPRTASSARSIDPSVVSIRESEAAMDASPVFSILSSVLSSVLSSLLFASLRASTDSADSGVGGGPVSGLTETEKSIKSFCAFASCACRFFGGIGCKNPTKKELFLFLFFSFGSFFLFLGKKARGSF